MRIKKPEKRMRAIMKLCDGLKRCNGGQAENAPTDGEEGTELLGGGGGCGNSVPKYRIDGVCVMLDGKAIIFFLTSPD